MSNSNQEFLSMALAYIEIGKAGIQIISATLMDEWREVANC
ncbi:hypothetical protein [Aeromonas rivipollensis]